MIELSISIIILVYFLNKSSLLKGIKDHINMWSSASVLSQSLEYSKDLNKNLKKASPEQKELAKSLLEGDLDFSKLLSEGKKDSKKLEDLVDELSNNM